MRLWHPLELADEEVVEPLATGIGVHQHSAGLGSAGLRRRGQLEKGERFDAYNLFHLRSIL